MEKNRSKMGRYYHASTQGQRRAAFFAALLTIALLAAAIALFFMMETDALRPTPNTAEEAAYLAARDAESSAVAAAQTAGRAVDSDAAVVLARINIAQAQMNMGQHTAAIRMIDNVAIDNPQDMRVKILQGNIYEATGSKSRAIEIYNEVLDQALSLEPEMQREALRGLGYSLMTLGDSDEALDALTRAALIPPESITLHLAAGELALELERWQPAAAHFYSVLRFDPENSVALENLGTLEREHSIESRAALEALLQGTAYPPPLQDPSSQGLPQEAP